MGRTCQGIRLSPSRRALLLLHVFCALRLGLAAQNGTHRERRRLIDKTSIDVRPKVGEEVDVIQVGIRCQKLSGIDVRGGMFKADVILTLRWKDDRVTELLPEGHNHLVLSKEAAAEDIWVPNVIPTNRDIKGLEEISQSTTINEEGQVERTRRMIVRMRQPYELKAYPYDKQTLKVVVASSRYMFDEVVLAEMEETAYKGVEEGVMGAQPWNLLRAYMNITKETSGSLRKSRGILNLEIERKPASVYNGTVFPEMLLVVIAWCVFFLPMVMPFVVPRVMTCLVCFLTMTAMTNKTLASLPDSGDLTWISVWEQCCSYLLFLSAVFNAGTEVVAERYSMRAFAERLRSEMALGFAILALVLSYLVHLRTDGEGLVAMSWYVRGMVLFAMIGFTVRAGCHVYDELLAKD